MDKILKNKKVTKNYSGFSLIEVLFAVFLITIGLIALMSLISSTMVESIDSRNQLIAGELAQEGVELVRNVRDNNWATNGDPVGHSFDHIAAGADCRIDEAYVFPANIDCTAGVSAKRLNINAAGLYVHSGVGAVATKFYRKLIISGVADRTVTSMVSWNGVFPASVATCNTGNKCAYTQITLSSWGEK